jgi:aminomethyltransferase
MGVDNVVKRTALYEKHVELGARMAAFAGFEMPMWYDGIKAEHLAVRSTAGIFDLSHMGEFFVEGREAFDLIQYLTCNDLRRIGDGQCQYTLLPTPSGGVVDDFIAYQFNPESYMLVVNASNIDKDFAWIVEHNKFDCKVTNRSDDYSLVAVQGPKTNDILTMLGFKRVAAQAAFTFRKFKHEGRSIILAGTGYTGERGFEIIVENKDAAWLWDSIMALKDKFGFVPVGLGARDTLRLEMAYSLYGHELSDEISVLEANLGWTVRFGPDYIGKDVLLKQKNEGVKRLVMGFVVDDKRGAPRHGAPVFNESGAEIGYVTSGSYSPSLDKGIALALLEPSYNVPGTRIAVEIRGARVSAEIVELPFYKK